MHKSLLQFSLLHMPTLNQFNFHKLKHLPANVWFATFYVQEHPALLQKTTNSTTQINEFLKKCFREKYYGKHF